MDTCELISESPAIPQKKCSWCQQYFPCTEDFFYKDARAKCGRRGDCRACVFARQRAADMAHPGRRRAYWQKHYRDKTALMTSEDIEKRNAKQAEYRAKNPEKVKALARIKSAAYRARNPEKVKAYDAEYRAKNPEKVKAFNTAWVANNRERKNANNTTWRKTHPDWRPRPETARASQARRRARKRRAPVNDFTAAQWIALQEAYAHRCAYCGKRAKGKLTQDHISPLGPEGPHTLHNIVPSCRSCNAKKGRKGPLKPIQPLLLL